MTEQEFDRVEEASTPPQPHFDDERTLLSARPVVPLERINAKVRHRRHWFLGGAFAVAMVLGAGSALLASYFRLRSVPDSTSEVSQQEVTAAPLAVAQSVPSESPVVESVAEPSITPIAPKKEPVVRHRTITRPSSDVDLPRDVPGVNEADDLRRIREAVLYDEWQERRARRVARRERRKLDRYNHRDLSNLDEIFEGRPRPY